MKSLLCAFFIFGIFSSLNLARAEKVPCLKVQSDAKVFRQSNKEKASIPSGTLLKPGKKNKKGNYYLVNFEGEAYWLRKADALLGKSSKCQVEEKVVNDSTSKPKIHTKNKAQRFQIRLGYSLGGDASATDGYITNVANPADVRKDQDILITENEFSNSFEISGSYIKELSKGRLRGSLGYRTNTVSLEGLRNPDSDNGGLPVPRSSLTEVLSNEASYNAVTLGVDYGFKLMSRKAFVLRGYIGAFMEYRLSDSDEYGVLVCGTESCPFKATPATVTVPIKQTAVAPSLSIEAEYKSFIFGIGLDTLYLPTLRVGMAF